MDPAHGKLEGFLDASQFALLAKMDQDVRDAEFRNELESDQKGDKAQGPQQGIGEVQNVSEIKRVESVLRSRKSGHRIEKIRRRHEKIADDYQKMSKKKGVRFDQEAALAALGWGSENKGSTAGKSRTAADPRQLTGGQHTFCGAGYGAHKAGDASTRRRLFRDLDNAFASGTAKISGKQRRAERAA